MSVTNLFAQALRTFGKTSAVGTNIAENVGNIRRYGTLSKQSRVFDDLSDVEDKVTYVRGILNGQIDDAFRQANVEPAGFIRDTVTGKQFVPAEHYKKQLNKVLGGKKGVSELLKGMPEDFTPKLEALAGELQTKIIADVDDIVGNFRKADHSGVTQGHLSLARYTKSAVNNHMQEINETMRAITKPFIDASPYKSWDDFQRLNWNDEILDFHANMAKKISPLLKQYHGTGVVSDRGRIMSKLAPLQEAMENFNEHNSIVLKGNELIDTRTLKWIYASEEGTNVHYLAKNGDKYSIKITPDGTTQPKNLTRKRLNEMDAEGQGFIENPKLHVDVNRLYSKEKERFASKFGRDDGYVKSDKKKDLEKFVHKEGIDDTNNVIRALKTLGLGAEYTSDSMSHSSLQLLGLLAKKAKAKTKRVESLLEQGLENPDYIGKTKVLDYERGVNAIAKKQYSPIRSRVDFETSDDLYGYNLPGRMGAGNYNTRMSASVELNPFRRIDGRMQQDPIGKNVNISEFFEGRNLKPGHRQRITKAVETMMEEDSNIRYSAKTLLDKFEKEGKFSRKLDVVNSLITNLDDAVPGLTYDKFLDNVLPAGVSHKKFVTDLAEEVVDIERNFKSQFGEKAKLYLDFSMQQFDDAGRMIEGTRPNIQIRHSGVAVRETLSAKDFLRQNFGYAAPLAPGFEFIIDEEK